ncbi:MAG: hypothetical protein AAF907_08295 [Planctomycetota bacterium]
MELLLQESLMRLDDKSFNLSTPLMSAEPLIAWVDAVGAVLLQPGERLTLGGPPKHGVSADLPLIAPLKPIHAAIVRVGEGWAVRSPAEQGAEEGELTALEADGGFSIGEDGGVTGTVTTPNPLSASAAVTLRSAHRPAPGWGPVRLEQAIIAAGPVLIGPGTDCHIRVRGAAGTLLLRPPTAGSADETWSVRGAEPPTSSEDDAPAGRSATLGWRTAAPGDALTGGGISLRLESLASPPR